MVESRHKHTPFPQVGLEGKIASTVEGPFMMVISGEVPVPSGEQPIGATRRAGKVSDVWMTVGASGKDDSNGLAVSGEVFINGTSCLTTVPSIRHISGEASQQKTTKVTGDTGITQAVLDEDANTFLPGSIITAEITGVERTATPTTEIQNVVIVVEVEPVSDSPHSY